MFFPIRRLHVADGTLELGSSVKALHDQVGKCVDLVAECDCAKILLLHIVDADDTDKHIQKYQNNEERVQEEEDDSRYLIHRPHFIKKDFTDSHAERGPDWIDEGVKFNHFGAEHQIAHQHERKQQQEEHHLQRQSTVIFIQSQGSIRLTRKNSTSHVAAKKVLESTWQQRYDWRIRELGKSSWQQSSETAANSLAHAHSGWGTWWAW